MAKPKKKYELAKPISSVVGSPPPNPAQVSLMGRATGKVVVGSLSKRSAPSIQSPLVDQGLTPLVEGDQVDFLEIRQINANLVMGHSADGFWCVTEMDHRTYVRLD